MPTLQKFKVLATQCALVAASPTRSPTASPVIHLRRRKTLRMLLNRTDRRGRFSCRDESSEVRGMDSDPNRAPPEKAKKKERNGEIRVRHKLKDLFVSSPPPEDRVSDKRLEEDEVGLFPATGSVGDGGLAIRRGGPGRAGSFRPVTATFRYRLLRRAWRPVLVTIPE
ncbi:uncharacterized protein LOC133860477 [Alnus glutinosa]|uniref:uncharacterized protein LOC133860477 n=1 Tax=Alnus glutinosa TaxID=3517 RepID=UPI002D76CAF8|nr:uncharacterized protein LOC133860477 [Alnus glutinosa]